MFDLDAVERVLPNRGCVNTVTDEDGVVHKVSVNEVAVLKGLVEELERTKQEVAALKSGTPADGITTVNYKQPTNRPARLHTYDVEDPSKVLYFDEMTDEEIAVITPYKTYQELCEAEGGELTK